MDGLLSGTLILYAATALVATLLVLAWLQWGPDYDEVMADDGLLDNPIFIIGCILLLIMVVACVVAMQSNFAFCQDLATLGQVCTPVQEWSHPLVGALPLVLVMFVVLVGMGVVFFPGKRRLAEDEADRLRCEQAAAAARERQVARASAYEPPYDDGPDLHAGL